MDKNETTPLKHATPKETLVHIDEIARDHARNYRDESDYAIPELVNDLAYRGQMTALRLERVKLDGVDQLQIIQGNRRADALYYLAHNNDPSTVSKEFPEGKPYIDPQTGKPFGPVKVVIYSGLDRAQRTQLKFDHGTTRNLNKAGLIRALWEMFDSQFTDKQVVSFAQGLLQEHYPPKKPIEDNDQARLEYYKGALAPHKTAWKSPTLLREAFLAKARGLQNWPAKGELNDAYKIYEKALVNDKSNSINRDNPGPEFMEFWNRLVAQKKVDAESGNTRTKNSAGTMNRNQIEELKKNTDSRILKTALDVPLQLRPRETWAALIEFLKPIEAAFTAEQIAVLDAINGVDQQAETKAEQPAAA